MLNYAEIFQEKDGDYAVQKGNVNHLGQMIKFVNGEITAVSVSYLCELRNPSRGKNMYYNDGIIKSRYV